jgi:hypothetical protein
VQNTISQEQARWRKNAAIIPTKIGFRTDWHSAREQNISFLSRPRAYSLYIVIDSYQTHACRDESASHSPVLLPLTCLGRHNTPTGLTPALTRLASPVKVIRGRTISKICATWFVTPPSPI